MRQLTSTEAIEIVEASHAQMQAAENKMQPFYPFGCKEPQQYEMYMDGLLKSSTFSIDGVPTFVFFWYSTFKQTMMITGAACLLDGNDRWQQAIDCAVALANKHNCKRVVIHSMRQGMAKKAMASGFVPTAVQMQKDL